MMYAVRSKKWFTLRDERIQAFTSKFKELCGDPKQVLAKSFQLDSQTQDLFDRLKETVKDEKRHARHIAVIGKAIELKKTSVQW